MRNFLKDIKLGLIFYLFVLVGLFILRVIEGKFPNINDVALNLLIAHYFVFQRKTFFGDK